MTWKMALDRYCNEQRFFVGFLGGAYILVVAFLDYITGTEVSLTVFYLSAIALFSWYYGRPCEILTACFSTIFWFYGDFLSKHLYSRPIFAYWNGAALLVFLLVFSITLYKLRLRFNKQQKLVITTQKVSAEIPKIVDMQYRFVSSFLMS